MPAGRPKSEVETEVVAIRIPKELGARLNRYVDLATSRGEGAKASKNSVVGYFIKQCLDAQDAKDKEHESIRQKSQKKAKVTQGISGDLRQKWIDLNANRKRIVRLLAGHPEGISPVEAKKALEAPGDLGDAMRGMMKEGLLRRIREGQYSVEPALLEILKTHEK